MKISEVIKSLPASNAAIKNTAATTPQEGWYPAYSASGQDVWLPDYRFDHSGIVVSAVGARCGKAFKADGKWNVCANTHPLFVDESKALRDYCWYMINDEDWWIKGGTAQPFVKVKDSLNREHTFPTLDEQAKIVAKLDYIQKIIQQKLNLIKALDNLIKARFVEMFGDQSSNPFSWKKEAIGNCCKLKSGISLDHSIENEGGPIPYVKVGDMNFPGNEEYITTSSRFVSKETAHKGLFSVGSVIFPKRGGAIGTNKKRLTKVPICADLNVMGVSSDGSILPEYLFVYFEMIDLASLSDGSSVPQINNKDIAPLEICIPPIDLQKNFASFVSQVDKSKFAVQKLLVASKNVLQLIKEDLNE